MAKLDFDPAAGSYSPKNLVSAAELADLCYKLPGSIHFKARGDWAFNKVTVQQVANSRSRTVVLANDEVVLVSFRGTVRSSIRSWLVNLDTKLVRGPKGLVHRGFRIALVRHLPRLLAVIARYRNQNQPVWFVGHSQGGAVAMIGIARLVYPRNQNPGGLITFGQPRAGDYAFARLVDRRVGTRFSRFINGNDIVPHAPPLLMRYRHAKRFLHFSKAGVLREKFIRVPRRGMSRNVRDHSMSTYLNKAHSAPAVVTV